VAASGELAGKLAVPASQVEDIRSGRQALLHAPDSGLQPLASLGKLERKGLVKLLIKLDQL
jgi:hypothetical protein